MMHWNLGWGAMMIGGLGMLALWALLVVLIIWAMRGFGTADGRSTSTIRYLGPRGDAMATPLEILQGRYASGEISREEYETIRQDLISSA